MGCNSDYMEQTNKERFYQDTAKLIIFALKSLKKPVPEWVKDKAEDYYCDDPEDELTPMLCGLCKKMTKAQKDKIIYNGKNKNSRLLADWWQEHKTEDRKREKEEREDKKQKERTKLKKQVLAKLTKKERDAVLKG